MSEWISVEDKLPEDMVEVLAYAGEEMAVAYLSRGQWESEDQWLFVDYVITHWMPLPPPPEAK